MDTNTAISIKTPQYYKCQYGRVELRNDENCPDWSNTLTFFFTADGGNGVISNYNAPENTVSARLAFDLLYVSLKLIVIA
jgi:hypothetical protein